MKNTSLKQISAVVPLILFIPLIRLLLFPPLEVVPNKNQYFIIGFDDASSGGNSVVNNLDVFNDLIIFKSTIGLGQEFPVTGLFIQTHAKGKYLNLSSYSHMRIKSSSTPPEPYIIYLKLFIDGVSSEGNHNSMMHLGANIHHPGEEPYETVIPLKDFIVPAWWYENLGLEDKKPPMDLSRVSSIDILRAQITEPTTTTLQIEKLEFYKEKVSGALLYGGLIVMFYLFRFFYFSRQKNDRGATALPRKPLEVDSFKNEEVKRITRYLSEHYALPDLSPGMVSQSTGISPRKITVLLKENFDLTFKQYLNRLRIQEAKRLLRDSDRRILEIALFVGYNNAVHFNRIFKETEDCTPKEYRQKSTRP